MATLFSATSNLKVLMNISTNTVLPPDSQVIKRDSIGCEMYRDFVTLRILPVLGQLRGISLWGKMSKKNLSLFFNATEPVQCRMKDKVIELRGERGLLTKFLLIQQKRPEIMNLEEAIGEYDFSAVPRSLFVSDGTLLLPSDKYELMKQTENMLFPILRTWMNIRQHQSQPIELMS